MDLKGLWRRYRLSIDGRMARLPADERRRLQALQLKTMHQPMSALARVLAVMGVAKVALGELGLLLGRSGSLQPWVAAAVLMSIALVFPRVASVATRSGLALAFLVALMVVMLGPVQGWGQVAGLTLGGVILLPVMLLPLVVRRQVALGLVVACALLVLVLSLAAEGVPVASKATLAFYFVLSTIAGLVLRRSRADLIVGVVASLEDAWHRANTDPLTRLLNRRGFTRQAAEALQGADGRTGPVLLFMDIDHFKQLNDTHGHAAGDEVLGILGGVIRARMGPGDLGARLGGEELACLLVGSTVEDARRFAERVRRNFRDRTREWGSTISIGIAAAAPAEKLPDLMARADEAMYTAKRQGRDQVVVGGSP
ncbi:MAG: diguanylate cyclase domain-containing protein [Lysobacteraceae bacterium]